MLRLSSYIHRDKLAEIISRWMINQPQPEDLATLKQIVNFNYFAMRVWLEDLGRLLFNYIHHTTPTRHRMRIKGEIKDFAVGHPSYTNLRIEQMRERYTKYPEDFYRETPIDGAFWVVPVGEAPHLVGCTRIKRFRRIAEKGSRRIVDFMLERIRANADTLAEQRARSLGIPKSQLITSHDEQVAEFAHAERRVLKGIKRGTIRAELSTFQIPDVAGVKVIVEPDQRARVFEALSVTGSCRILEVEEHRGPYNATNVRVAYRLPRELLLGLPPVAPFTHVFAARGFDLDRLADDYRQFILSGDEQVELEIIVSTFQDYLESEIGRSMHEERILSQRSHKEYNAHLATNVRYLLDYIFTLCRAPPCAAIQDVPVKLWVKYMPDTIERLGRQLLDRGLPYFDTIAEGPADGPPPAAGNGGGP